MADLEKTVAIIFEGVDQMGSGVDSATRRIDGIAGAVEGATQPLADLTLGILKFEGALIAGGAAVTAFAVKLAGDFDSQFREISTLIDAPAEALEGFRGELREYGSTSTQTLEQVNSAVYGAISAGVDYTDSIEAVRQAERLAVAGRADLAESNTLLVSTLNAYGASAQEAERYSDMLFQTVRSGQTTIPELGQSLSQVTGIAAAGGVDFAELSGAIAALTAAGAPTSQAITQIRGAISAILKPTSDAAGLADELGIEFNAAALETKGLQGVMQDAADATGGSTEQMARLFGSVEALNGVLTLTGTGADKFVDSVQAIENSAGATSAAYEKMADDIENGTQRIQNAMTGALIGIGTPLLDEFGGIQEAIAEIFNAIGASVEGGQLSGFVDELEGLFQGIEDTLREVAQNLPEALEEADFSSFFDGIQAIQDAVANLFDGADLTSADGLVSVIETLGLGFEALAQYTAGAIEGIGPFLEQLAELTQWFLELDPAVFAAAGTVGAVAVALNTASTAMLAFNKPLRALAGSGGLLAKAAPLVTTVAGALAGPAGLAVLAGAAAVAVAKFAPELLGMNDALEESARKIEQDAQRWEEFQAAVEGVSAEEYRRFAEEFGLSNNDVVQGIAETRETIEDLQARMASWEDPVSEWNWGSALDIVNVATQESIEKQRQLAAEVFGVAEAQDEANRKMADAAGQDPWSELRDAYLDYRDAFVRGEIEAEEWAAIQEEYRDRLAEATDDAAKSQEALAGEVLTTEEAILEARQAVQDYELSMEELASNERIKAMEFTASVNIAALQADAQKVEAILNATSQTITELGSATNDMFGTLASGDLSRFQELDLENAIDQQLEIQREAHEQQKELIDEQIRNLRERTRMMQSGEGLIKIDSTGLEPALEMILWEILEKIQLRANAESAEFLLGLPS